MGKNKKMDEDFYKDEIGVLDWLKDDVPQKIRFSDRYEHKVNNKLHRIDGPAIEHFDGVGDLYYFDGHKLSIEEWTNLKRINLIDKVIDKI